jgi:hypothetical protein
VIRLDKLGAEEQEWQNRIGELEQAQHNLGEEIRLDLLAAERRDQIVRDEENQSAGLEQLSGKEREQPDNLDRLAAKELEQRERVDKSRGQLTVPFSKILLSSSSVTVVVYRDFQKGAYFLGTTKGSVSKIPNFLSLLF